MGRIDGQLKDGPPEVQELAAALRQLRRSAGLSYEQIGARLHISKSTAARMADGSRCPTQREAAAFVQACGGQWTVIEPLWAAARRARHQADIITGTGEVNPNLLVNRTDSPGAALGSQPDLATVTASHSTMASKAYSDRSVRTWIAGVKARWRQLSLTWQLVLVTAVVAAVAVGWAVRAQEPAGRATPTDYLASGRAAPAFLTDSDTGRVDANCPPAAGPLASAFVANRSLVFGKATNNTLIVRGWSQEWLEPSWNCLGGDIGSAPAADSWSDGTVMVLAQPTDGAPGLIRRMLRRGTTWLRWDRLPTPTVATHSPTMQSPVDRSWRVQYVDGAGDVRDIYYDPQRRWGDWQVIAQDVLGPISSLTDTRGTAYLALPKAQGVTVYSRSSSQPWKLWHELRTEARHRAKAVTLSASPKGGVSLEVQTDAGTLRSSCPSAGSCQPWSVK